MNGYIVKGIGGFYYVKTPDGIVECKPRGIFRKQKWYSGLYWLIVDTSQYIFSIPDRL